MWGRGGLGRMLIHQAVDVDILAESRIVDMSLDDLPSDKVGQFIFISTCNDDSGEISYVIPLRFVSMPHLSTWQRSCNGLQCPWCDAD